MATKRVCIVGAGPSGMAALYQFGNMTGSPEVVCYEKTGKWGGMWNYTWQTGTDGFGEPCRGGMYRQLWSNGPKECLEFPDYTFEQHFGKAIPSFPPRAVLRDYLEGRWTKSSKKDLKKMITFNHVVRYIRYDTEKDDFIVTVGDLSNNTNRDERFTHVIIAVGIFNVPNVPDFKGIETFPGRILHSNNFRDANEFKGQRILIFGASYSAEDISLQCMKFGAKNVVVSWRSKPMGFKFPEGIKERPLVQKFEKNTAFFKDGHQEDFDAIIFATGYKYHFPFMENSLRLISTLSVYPDNLYKGTLWIKGGNNKVFYLGCQDQYYSYTMFEAQALWACKYIVGSLPNEPVAKDKMAADVAENVKRRQGLKDCYGDIDMQSDFIADLCKQTGYNNGIVKSRELFNTWEDNKHEDIATYRDQSYTSIFTGTPSPKHSKPWFSAMDDSLETFVN